MKSNLIFLILPELLLITLGCNPVEPEDNSIVTDFDGNVYPTVLIGDQLWMTENLRTTHYADGTLLFDGTSTGLIYDDITTKYSFWLMMI